MLNPETMNGDAPPERLAAEVIEAMPRGGDASVFDSAWSKWERPLVQFTWWRTDGRALDYRRWRDDDGDWFYLFPTALEQHLLVTAQPCWFHTL